MSEQVHTSPSLREQIFRAIRDDGMPYYMTRLDRCNYANWGAEAVMDILREAGLIGDEA